MTDSKKLLKYIKDQFVSSDEYMSVLREGVRYIYEPPANISLVKGADNAGLIGVYARGEFYFLSDRYKHVGKDYVQELTTFEELYNTKFDKQMKLLSEKSVPVTVVLADLDGLKAINDSFGHAAGDNAIRVTASALKESCPEDALCVRFGGDEMLAVICGPCNAIEIKAKIRKYLSDYNRRSSNGYKISASVGTYITNSAGDVSFEALVKASDSDMYVEKQSKKNK